MFAILVVIVQFLFSMLRLALGILILVVKVAAKAIAWLFFKAVHFFAWLIDKIVTNIRASLAKRRIRKKAEMNRLNKCNS